MVSKLLAATGNPGKLKEIKAILRGINIDIISPNDISLNIEVAETGVTYAQNARIKAEAYYRASGLPILADDSGLEVDILNGKPGIHSARFSPKEHATDADRREYLLKQLKNKSHPWKAHFHCTAILLIPNRVIVEINGRCDGVIIPEEHGEHGFGYDPIFFVPEFAATMAELKPPIKNLISHRAKALKALMPDIFQLLVNKENK
jgi:XTP/dITP diphosphohydrolase